jgi:hypothetical protein
MMWSFLVWIKTAALLLSCGSCITLASSSSTTAAVRVYGRRRLGATIQRKALDMRSTHTHVAVFFTKLGKAQRDHHDALLSLHGDNQASPMHNDPPLDDEHSPNHNDFHRRLLSLTTYPMQSYYIPIPESPLLASLQTLAPTIANQQMESIISIAISSDKTIIWYDHWEDGFDKGT